MWAMDRGRAVDTCITQPPASLQLYCSKFISTISLVQVSQHNVVNVFLGRVSVHPSPRSLFDLKLAPPWSWSEAVPDAMDLGLQELMQLLVLWCFGGSHHKRILARSFRYGHGSGSSSAG